MDDFSRQREQMVRKQLVARGLRNEALLNAMRTVPRETFVPEHLRNVAYEDRPLPIDAKQTISQPYIVALMIDAMEIQPGDCVLEVGAGSGYAAAVMGQLAERVYGIEYHEVLADQARERIQKLGYDNAEIIQGDGNQGWPQHAPFDAILVSASGAYVPPALLEQLKTGGHLVIPLDAGGPAQELLRIRKGEDGEQQKESLSWVRFVPLVQSES